MARTAKKKLKILDEGVEIADDAEFLDFTGAGVAGGLVGSGVVETINGGAGAGVAIQGSGTYIQSTGTVQFSNSNGVTFGLSNNGVMTASVNAAGGGLTNINFSAGSTSQNLSAITFDNANGVSFGLNGSVVTASHNGLTSQSAQALSGSNGSFTFQTATFGNLNGLSFYTSNGSFVGSYTVPTQTVDTNKAGTGFTSAGNNIGLSGTLNTNGLSLSATVPTQSNQNVSLYALGNTTQNSSTVLNASNLSFNAIGSLTVGYSNGSIQFSAPNALTTAMASNRGSDFVQANAVFNGTNASGTIASNGISISVNPAAAGVGIEAGTRTATTAGNIRFETGNGITFGLNGVGGSVMTASHNGLTSQTNQNVSLYALGNTTQNSSTVLNASNLSFNAIGSLTVGYSNGSIQLSAPNALTSQSNQAASAGNGSFAFQTLSFSNLNGISFGTSAGSAITASHNGLTTARASNDGIGLNTAQSNVTWTVNSSGLSFDARGYAGTGTSATNASITLNSNGLAISVGAGGGVTPVVSNSAGSFSFTTLNFSNANNVTWGTSAGSIITASVAAPGAAAENNNINLLGANTAGNTTASGSTIGWSGINLTLSGTNASVVNISAPATSSLSATGQVSLSVNGSTISIGVPVINTLSSYWEGLDRMTLLHAGANGQISVERFKLDQYVSASMIAVPQYQSISSSAVANTYGQVMSVYAMILTNDTVNNRLMSLSSSSVASTYTLASNNAGNTGIIGSGVRPITCPININATPGIYYLAFNVSTNTFSSGTATTALNRTASFIGRNVIASASFAMVSNYTQATANTVNRFFPQGVVSGGASAGIPATISHSQMTMTGLSHSQANLAFYLQA